MRFSQNSIEPIRAAFEDCFHKRILEYGNLWVQFIKLSRPAYTWRRKTAELTRDAFISSLCPDVVYVSTCFEG
jgi:hypothetical protein